MSGYSATPLAKKLGIKPGGRLGLLMAPRGWQVPDLPDDVKVQRSANKADVVIVFCRAMRDVENTATEIADSLGHGVALWIAWPRKAAGHVSDVTENQLRDWLLPLGVVDVKVAALDEDWSGLKFVRRKERGAPAVLRAFFDNDGRLVSIPAREGKRRVVLDAIAQRFEPGRRYSEREVNEVLRGYHGDFAALRRYLVDGEFLERQRGVYWRAGGTVDV